MDILQVNTADNVARWFIHSNNLICGDDADEISNLKLQKLLYYAQGLHLAMYGRPLFNDEIIAWQHGPVVKAVYEKYKHNGRSGIVDAALPDDTFTKEAIDIMTITLHNFGQFSAWKLRDMTHEETPWKVTDINHVISQDIIKKYFEEHYIEED